MGCHPRDRRVGHDFATTEQQRGTVIPDGSSLRPAEGSFTKGVSVAFKARRRGLSGPHRARRCHVPLSTFNQADEVSAQLKAEN